MSRHHHGTNPSFFFINIVRMFLMGGFPRPEPTLSEAGHPGTDLYRLKLVRVVAVEIVFTSNVLSFYYMLMVLCLMS